MRSYSTQAIIKPKKDSSKRGWKICSVWRRFWAPPLMPHGMEQPLGNSHLWAPAWREKQKSGLCMQPLACQTAYRSKFPWIGFWCSILFLLLDHVSWFLCMSSNLLLEFGHFERKKKTLSQSLHTGFAWGKTFTNQPSWRFQNLVNFPDVFLLPGAFL